VHAFGEALVQVGLPVEPADDAPLFGTVAVAAEVVVRLLDGRRVRLVIGIFLPNEVVFLLTVDVFFIAVVFIAIIFIAVIFIFIVNGVSADQGLVFRARTVAFASNRLKYNYFN